MPPLRARRPIPWLLLVGCGLAGVLLAATRCGPEAPTTAALPARVLLVPPLNDAVRGEELHLRTGPKLYTWRVLNTTDEAVEVEFVTTWTGDGAPPGGVPPAQRYVWPRNGFGIPNDFVVRAIEPDRIEVGGRSWECWRLRCHARQETRYYWISEEVQVHGVLRIAVDLNGDGRPDTGNEADRVEPK